jgi:hypothetical protein
MELNKGLEAARRARIERKLSGRTVTPKEPNLDQIRSVEARLNDVPDRFKNLMRDVYLGKPSLRRAINAKCVECCGFEDVHDRVGNCTTKRCPLWLYRPYQDRMQSEGDEQ